MANNTCAQPPALYQGDGSTTKYSFAFQYIETSDIAVFLWDETTESFQLCTQVANSAACSGSPYEYYFTSATPVELTFCVAPPLPPDNRPDWFSNIIIIRQTDICQMVAYFYPGSPVRAQDLNNNFTQILLALQDVEGRLYQFIENYQGFVRITGDTMEGGPLDMNTFQLTGVPDPLDDTDAVPFAWAENEYINADGDTMRGTLNMNGKDLTGVPYPSVDSDAANKKYVDDEISKSEGEAEDKFVNVVGDTMTGELVMSGEHVKEVRWPVDSADAVNKAYVDAILNGTGGDLAALPVVRAIFTARGGETILDPIPNITPGNEIVTVNGSTLTPNDDYTIQGKDTITLRQPLIAGDLTMILCYNSVKVVEVSSNFETYPFTRWVDTATAGQTVFQGNGDGDVTLGYSPGYEQVTLNGSRLTRDVDYSANDKLSVILVQGALEGDVLEVLCGNYLKTGDQESYAASDISYTYPGGVPSNVQERLEQYVSVKDFGAVGDGVTDDTAAIQAAINSIPGNLGLDNNDPQGRVINLVGGIYKVTSPLSATNANGLIIENGTLTAAGSWANGSAVIEANPNWQFRLTNVTIECNQVCNGIRLDRAVYGKLENVYVHGFGDKEYGFKSSVGFGGMAFHILDCRFAGPISAATISYTGTATAILITGGSDCTIHNTETIRVACGVEIRSGGWVVSDNHFTGQTGGAPGLRLNGGNHTRVLGNEFDNSWMEIINTVTPLVVSDNIFRNGTVDEQLFAIKWIATTSNVQRLRASITGNVARLQCTDALGLRFIKDEPTGSGSFGAHYDTIVRDNLISGYSASNVNRGGITATEGNVYVRVDSSSFNNGVVAVYYPGLVFGGSNGQPLPRFLCESSLSIDSAVYNTSNGTIYLSIIDPPRSQDLLLSFRCDQDTYRRSDYQPNLADTLDNWLTSAITVSASSETDPQGQTGAFELTPDAALNSHWITNVVTKSSAAPLLMSTSIALKAQEYSFAAIVWRGASASDTASVVIDLSTGQIVGGYPKGGFPDIRSNTSTIGLNNGWWNIMTRSTTDSAADFIYQVFVLDDTSGAAGDIIPYTGNNSDSILAYNPKIQELA